MMNYATAATPSYQPSITEQISRSAQARQRAFSQTPTLHEDENAGVQGNRKNYHHDRSSELLDETTYNS